MVLDLSWPVLWHGLLWPLMRLTFFISLGLFVGNLIESLHWTRHAARLADPLARRARLKDVSAASFSMAFFSGVTANTMLSEAHEKGTISDRELMLSNLFNSLPTYFLHLPTVFFIAAPFIGATAAVYVGLTALAAVLRTGAIVAAGRFLLPPVPEGCLPCRLDEAEAKRDRGSALRKTWRRFLKRLPKVLYLTAPIYTVFFLLKQAGLFAWLEDLLAGQVGLFSFLPPEALSIVVFHMAAEFTAGLAVASALITDAGLTQPQVVLALMLGNVLSSPMRAFRHQFPYYAGIFRPRMAMKLIVCNQALRVVSLVLVGTVYALLA
ncbi:MAG: hypothetical protein KUA35_01125 [Pseudodesulfovibrio sp.]|uniref:Nucleoside recognition domain protein n=1 Tax=Pseudodesulfovibrio aespoeensis (strain ATCC 700646 / DSM 10631 / Aspo-2) TaxID=643562 RepID=E6VV70_PSEA9|nr:MULTISPECIES: membrane protein [Pseudodesulfovibrio]MBU4191388.1 hypothetical protein [Pseudomonadota bacterium]ADU61221.1 nucleoside recognition domain protein [Pseudodesulfovibrio aespoeensis Aspo-2]MBU4244028.1 hypothetical protein [Pseudomonadota bacterium]MBU4378306.1 hypothetical protein [Pseudomonadota bacterium]MBU4474279.1 hypothetical protein [Pseudomonadota bacterium]